MDMADAEAGRMDRDQGPPMTPPAEPTRDEMIAWLEREAAVYDYAIENGADMDRAAQRDVERDVAMLRAIAARLKEDGA